MAKRRKSRRDVSPRTERDAAGVSSLTRLSLSGLLDSAYDDMKRRHTGAFETRSVNDFVNTLNSQFVKQQRRTEGSQKVKPAVSDRRFWHPDKAFVGATHSGREASVIEGHLQSLSAVTCARRKERREVMFASGHGGRAHRARHRWTEASSRRCY